MISNWILIMILLAAALLPIIVFWFRESTGRRFWSKTLVGLWVAAPLACLLVTYQYCGRPVLIEDLPADRPVQVLIDDYVGSNACMSCHPQQHASWHQSYHRGMTQVISPETVVAEFPNAEESDEILTTMDGRDYQIGRRGDSYVLKSVVPSLTPPYFRTIQRPLVMSTGSHHMQLYWYSTGQTRLLGMLPFVYLIEDQQWIPRDAAFLGVSGPSSDEIQRWNATCIRCHTTHPRSRVFSGVKVDSQVAEFGISCEACHGPGGEHVRVNSNPLRRYQNHFSDQPSAKLVNPALLPHKRGSAVCGLCHAVSEALSEDVATAWRVHGFKFRPGDDLAKHRRMLHPSRRDDSATQDTSNRDKRSFEETFWSDGVVRVNGREYSALLENPCFQRGKMSCFSCHSMHQKPGDPRPAKEWADDQLKPLMRTNHACLQCHKKYREPEKMKSHTHHLAGSSGSQCMNCHMSMTAYGLLKATRSHQIEIPDVSTSLATGRPNACNQCHLDQSLSWAADNLKQWYGTEPPKWSETRLPKEWSKGEPEEVSAALLWLLKGDAGQRALMAWSFGWQPARENSEIDLWGAPFLIQLLEDPYPAVRYIAARSLKGLPDYADMDYDFLSDPEQTAQDRNKLRSLWMQNKSDRLQGRWKLLIDEDGNLQYEKLKAMWEKRNRKHIFLAE